MSKITFSFGKNWYNFIKTVDDESVRLAEKELLHWFDISDIQNKEIIDIGCGSGIHSFAFFKHHPQKLISFDYDEYSIKSTEFFHKKAGNPANWILMQGSILDDSFINQLGKFDIVYSWGVLHHTGNMWKAIENAAELVKEGGKFLVALYVKGPRYEYHLAIKKEYNAGSWLRKKRWEFRYIIAWMKKLKKEGKNPFKLNQKLYRGMSIYHDIKDWLGGLPYEVASKEEVVGFLSGKGFNLIKIEEADEGGCSTYLFQKR